jgi:3-dehydroquinate dehydratase/shikimate dehydrogenase
VNTPLVCATVTASTTAELRRRRDEVTDADLVELRLDTVSDPSAAGALAGRRLPAIVTCRPAWEGGRFLGAEEDRRRILAEALSAGAEWVDIEWRADFRDLVAQTGGKRVVLSNHDFDGMPIDLAARARAMRSTGAEVVKIAGATERLSDCLPLLDLAAREGTRHDLVLVGMGEAGLSTRVLAARFGSRWTYTGTEHHVGQITAAALLEDYRFRRLTPSTDLYGVVGRPVAHSVSPAMHNAAFAATGCDAVYLPLPAASADDFVTFARAMGLKGASVTIPYKVTLGARVDEMDAIGRRIGAINTISVREGRWLGANTDATAFLEPLAHRVPLEGMRTAVVGAGGAARAVAIALASSGSRVRVHARDPQRAEQVARPISAEVGGWPPEPGSWDLLVNCTPVGMYPHVDETPVPGTHLTGPYVYDLIYNPTTTRLMREARLAGCHAIGGLDMLVAQAHEQFQSWTGTRPPHGIMREAALQRLAEFAGDAPHVV